MVFGFQLSFARVGSAVNFIVMEPLYRYVKHNLNIPNYQSLSVVLIIGMYYICYLYIYIYFCNLLTYAIYILASLTCFISLLSALLLAWQDKRAERLLHRKTPDVTEVVKMTDVRHFPNIFWLVTFIIVCYYTSIFPFIALGKYVYLIIILFYIT